jgi:hypothetical protein
MKNPSPSPPLDGKVALVTGAHAVRFRASPLSGFITARSST